MRAGTARVVRLAGDARGAITGQISLGSMYWTRARVGGGDGQRGGS